MNANIAKKETGQEELAGIFEYVLDRHEWWTFTIRPPGTDGMGTFELQDYWISGDTGSGQRVITGKYERKGEEIILRTERVEIFCRELPQHGGRSQTSIPYVGHPMVMDIVRSGGELRLVLRKLDLDIYGIRPLNNAEFRMQPPDSLRLGESLYKVGRDGEI